MIKRSFALHLLLAGLIIVSAAFVRPPVASAAANTCGSVSPAESNPKKVEGFTYGCERGSMNWSNMADSCTTTWLSSVGYTGANANDWSSSCIPGYAAGTQQVLNGPNGVLTTAGKQISAIDTMCNAKQSDTRFIAGCRIGYIGKLNGYAQDYTLVCPSFSASQTIEQSGCAAGYQQAEADLAAAAAPPSPPPGSPITPPPSGSPVTPPVVGTPTPGHIPSTVGDVINLIKRLTNWMFTFFLLFAVIMIIYAAFIYLTSGGGEEVGKAHKMMVYAAVAIAVATLAQGIVTVVQRLVTG